MFKQTLLKLYNNLTATPCLLCGASSQKLCLCPHCMSTLPHLHNACPRCAAPTHNNALCGKCLQNPPAQDATTSVFAYTYPIDRLISDFKYHDKLFLTQFFAYHIAKKVKHQPLPDMLIPVPLHPKRLRQRGYNQSLLLAKVIAKHLAIPVSYNKLIRIKNSVAQASLTPAKRKQNVKHAFKLQDDRLPRHVALIDDVLTTGYTAHAAASALRKAGIARIELWTIARTIKQTNLIP